MPENHWLSEVSKNFCAGVLEGNVWYKKCEHFYNHNFKEMVMVADNGNSTGKNPTVAYALNLFLPGIGNIYFDQLILGILTFLLFLLAIFLFFAGGGAGLMGIIVIVVSLLAAIPTAGLALIIGLPVGLLLLLIGVGAIVSIGIWVICVLVSEFFVYQKDIKAKSQA